MKSAKIGDHWRRLGRRKARNHLQSITAESVPNVPRDSIHFPGPITAITGLNGVGKSTLLHAARTMLRRDGDIKHEIVALRQCTGILTGQLISDNTAHSVTCKIEAGTVANSPESVPFPVTWIDPAFEIPSLVKAFRQEQNLQEALDQTGSFESSKDDLDLLSWLVGKTYSFCESYELEGFQGRPETPYFRVTSEGLTYGTEAMGLGEASIHFLFWNLNRMPRNSIILLEEPETYISARSQAAIMDALAATCLEKECSAIVTTHSPQIFNRIPPSDTLILIKDGHETISITKESQAARLIALGVPPIEEKLGIILVEDRVAREFSYNWIRYNKPLLLRSWKVLDVDSAGQVISKVESFPNVPEWFKTIGLLDGDERGKNHKQIEPLCFLPGEDPPEILLKASILKHIDTLAEKLALDPDIVRLAISGIDGEDHHDWLIELVKRLETEGTNFQAILSASFQLWAIDNAELQAAAFAEFIQKLSA